MRSVNVPALRQYAISVFINLREGEREQERVWGVRDRERETEEKTKVEEREQRKKSVRERERVRGRETKKGPERKRRLMRKMPRLIPIMCDGELLQSH